MVTAEQRAEKAERLLLEAQQQLQQLQQLQQAAQSAQNNVISAYRGKPKLPDFYINQPEVRFVQVEAEFDISGITAEQTKARHVISRLPGEAAAYCCDIMTNDTIVDKYMQIKTRIMNTYGQSAAKKLRQLLNKDVQVDGKPSQVLHRIKLLNQDSHCDNDVVRSIFIELMPSELRPLLIASDIQSIEKLAEHADKIVEYPRVDSIHSSVAAFSHERHKKSRESSADSRSISKLSEEVASLSRAVEDLKVLFLQSRKERGSSSSRGRSKSRENSGLC